METTKLSSKGQVIIPKHIRESYQWSTGLEFQLIEYQEGILLKPKAAFEKTSLADVTGCLQYNGPKKSDEEIFNAMKQAVRESWRDSN